MPLSPKGSSPDKAQVFRFKFPKDLVDQAKVEINQTGNIQLFPARNDPLMYLYNSVLAIG